MRQRNWLDGNYLFVVFAAVILLLWGGCRYVQCMDARSKLACFLSERVVYVAP